MALLVTYPFCFFNDTATTEIYTLSLHDALPIYATVSGDLRALSKEQFTKARRTMEEIVTASLPHATDRKSTRLNSSHANISYAVFCLKKKKRTHNNRRDKLAHCATQYRNDCSMN